MGINQKCLEEEIFDQKKETVSIGARIL